MTGISDTQRNAILAAAGGLLWVVVPAVSATGLPRLSALLGIGAVLGVSFGLLELWFSHADRLTAAGRVGCVLLGLGLGLLFVAAVASGMYPEGNIAATFVIGLPVIAGGLVAAVGSVFLAVSLHTQRTISSWTAILLGCGLPVDLLLNTIGAQFLPIGVSIYGIAWISLGYRLSDSRMQPISDSKRTPDDRGGSLIRGLSPDVVVGGTVGIVFTIVGIAGLVLGAKGLPFTGRTILLSGIHLSIGVLGVGAASVGPRALRLYNLGAGLLLLGITVGWAIPSIRATLGLSLTGQLLHLPLGLLLLATHVARTHGPSPTDNGL